MLKLTEYFKRVHVPKLGLRFFFGHPQGPIENRPEVGAVEFPEVPSFQIDRGIFENDLRQMVAQAGVSLFEDWMVRDVQLSQNDEPHHVMAQRRGEQSTEQLRCRWVVDATGRRRLLQSKLGLKKENGHQASAAWFRMAGRLDIDDLVAPSRKSWHARVPNRTRYYSTNHLMGPGYWVWLIPLGSGNTSVGIVTSETRHPFQTYHNYDMAYQWLRKHEPRLARYLGDRQPMDFLGYKNYSYTSHQVISYHRWACVGEAGVFTDPFYSPGSDFICMGSTIVNDLIGMDADGTLDRDFVEDVNALFMSINDSYVDLYRGSYDIFGVTHVMTAKILWDWAIYWAFFAQLCFQNLLASPDHIRPVFELGRKYLHINQMVQQLFRDWGGRTTSHDGFDFLNPFDVPFVLETHLDLQRRKTGDETLADIENNQSIFEDWAHVLFRRALQETDPTAAHEVASQRFNTSNLTLDRNQWAADGFSQAKTPLPFSTRMDHEMQAVWGTN
jgi:hypothetical protein